jgi:hypothetical protein
MNIKFLSLCRNNKKEKFCFQSLKKQFSTRRLLYEKLNLRNVEYRKVKWVF